MDKRDKYFKQRKNYCLMAPQGYGRGFFKNFWQNVFFWHNSVIRA